LNSLNQLRPHPPRADQVRLRLRSLRRYRPTRMPRSDADREPASPQDGGPL